MRVLPSGLALLLVLTSAACRTQQEIRDPLMVAPDAKPQYFDLTGKPDQDPNKRVDPDTCKHVYEQIGLHPYQQVRNGIPMGSLCTITRCLRCGEIRHECNPAYRARPGLPPDQRPSSSKASSN